MATGLLSLVVPAWVSSDQIDPSWAGIVKSVDSNFGTWGLCIDVQFDSVRTLVKFNDAATNYNTSQCYAYFTPSESKIVRYDGRLVRDDYRTSICAHFAADNDRASRALGIMTGLSTDKMETFLKKTCSATGKASLGLHIATTCLYALGFFSLLFGACCCKSIGGTKAARYLINVGILCTAIMSFVVFSQMRLARGSDSAVYSVALYLDIIATVFACIAVCVIERFEISLKKEAKAIRESDLKKALQAQNEISVKNKADMV